MEIGAGAVLVADVITFACLCRVEFLRQLCRGINHRRKLLFLFCSLRRTYLRSPLCPAQHYVDITNKRQFAQVDEFKQGDCNGKRLNDLPWLLLRLMRRESEGTMTVVKRHCRKVKATPDRYNSSLGEDEPSPLPRRHACS